MEGKRKTYRNSQLGFEIDIPDDWPVPIVLDPDSVIFNRAPLETFGFVVGALAPERLMFYTELEFRAYAHK